MTGNDESADEDTIAETNVASGGDISGPRRIAVEGVAFHQADAGGVVYSRDNGGVITWSETSNDRSFPGIGWCNRARDNLTSVETVLPVIVAVDQRPCGIVQFEFRILQGTNY